MELTVWTDLRKLFSDYHIYLCMIGLGVIYILMYLSSLSYGGYQSGIVTSYSGIADGSEIMLLSFILCTVGGSNLYCAEEQHGYLNFEIQRIGVGRYTASKVLTSILGGFCTLLVGELIFAGGIFIHQYFVLEAVFMGNENWMALLWMCLFSSLRGGVLSAIGFLVSTYVANYYIAMTMPLLIYYMMLTVEYWVSHFFAVIPSKFYFSKVYMAGAIQGNDFSEFIFALLYTACISVILYRMAKRCIERRLEHA